MSTQPRQHVDRSVFHESQTNQVSLNTQLEFGFNLSPTGQPWRDCWSPSPCSKPTPQPCLSGGETSAEAEKEDPYNTKKSIIAGDGGKKREEKRTKVVRHRFLVSACKGSNPFTPDYEHPKGSVKNELTTTGKGA